MVMPAPPIECETVSATQMWRTPISALHFHALRHLLGYRSDCDCVVLEASLDMDALASKRSNGLWLSCECIDLVARHKRVAASALDALLDALSVSLSRHHVFLAAHGIDRQRVV